MYGVPRCAGEQAEARLREWAPREKPSISADLLTEHQYYLAPLLPPATFLADPSTAPESLLRIEGIRSVLHAAGRTLGGSDELTDRRWEHMADGAQLTQLCAVLVHEVIGRPAPQGGAVGAHAAPPARRVRPARPTFLSRARSFLPPSLPPSRPRARRAPQPLRPLRSAVSPPSQEQVVARARRRRLCARSRRSTPSGPTRASRRVSVGAAGAHARAPHTVTGRRPPPPLTNRTLRHPARPGRGSPPRNLCGDGRDAWLAAPAGSLFKDCIPGLFLQTMLEVLAEPFFTPSDLRVDHHLLDPGGAREADLPALRADGEAFCTVHPCARRDAPRRSHLCARHSVAPRPAPDLANPPSHNLPSLRTHPAPTLTAAPGVAVGAHWVRSAEVLGPACRSASASGAHPQGRRRASREAARRRRQ